MLRIHSFESLGTFDGPGIRLVVFMQGCNFGCLYCANPDTIPIGKGGKLIENAEILRRAVSEKPFFGKRGGITFSGGEPTIQAKELIPLCRELKKEGIHIVLDSNVLTPFLFSKAMNLDAFSILAAIMIFGGLWGFWGVFFSIPLATFISTLIVYWPNADEDAQKKALENHVQDNVFSEEKKEN